MRTLMLGAVLLLAAVSPAVADGLSCTGEADGPSRAKVVVEFVVDASGAVTRLTANWFPPVKSGGVAAVLKGAPTIGIGYGNASVAGLGAPTSLSAISVLSLHRSTVEGGEFVATLDGDACHQWNASPSLDLDAHKSWEPMTMAFGLIAAAHSEHGPVNPDLLPALETARTSRIRIFKNGKGVGDATVVELYDHATRDALFRMAWDAASKALHDPSHCVRTN